MSQSSSDTPHNNSNNRLHATLHAVELDDSSDSEWLDIASGRESDTDSIFSGREIDTDHAPSRSRSRRSSMSYDSSRDGDADVDGWEGFVDGANDGNTTLTNESPAGVSSSPEERPEFPTLEEAASPIDEAEEQAVREGLEQSMVSTLSTSRSSSLQASTVASSTRDLRLSFPDPLTSSNELQELHELMREHSLSEQEQSSQEPSSQETECSLVPTELAYSSSDVGDAPRAGDPGPSTTPAVSGPALAEKPTLAPMPVPVPVPAPVTRPTPKSRPSFAVSSDFDIILYGLPTAPKWALVDRLLQQAAAGAGVTLSTSLENLSGSTRYLYACKRAYNGSFPNVIRVVDQTGKRSEDFFEAVAPEHASLAIFFLPFELSVLPHHTSYLPVYTPLADDLNATRLQTRQSWDAMKIPFNAHFLMMSHGRDVVDETFIQKIPPSQVLRAFDKLWSNEINYLKLAKNSSALILFVLFSMVLGTVVRSSYPLLRSTKETVTHTWVPSASPPLSLSPALDHTVPTLPPGRSPSTSVMISSLKDTALSVFDHHSHSPPVEELYQRGPKSSTQRSKPTTDIEVPASTGLSFDAKPKSLSIVPDMSSSLSVVPSALSKAISPVLSSTPAAGFTVRRTDVQDIIDALDELTRAITRSARTVLQHSAALVAAAPTFEDIDLDIDMAMEKSQAQLRNVKETLYRRNTLAQRRAKEMKEVGLRWMAEKSELVLARSEHARERAKEYMGEVERWSEQWAESGRSFKSLADRILASSERSFMKRPWGGGSGEDLDDGEEAEGYVCYDI